MSPGVYGIRPGMRLFELIEAAGGIKDGACFFSSCFSSLYFILHPLD